MLGPTAFAGKAIVMQASFDGDGKRLLGDLCALGGGIARGLTTLVIRTTGLSNAGPAQTLFYQLIVSGVSRSVTALVFGCNLTLPQTAAGWTSMVYQTTGVTTLSLLGWFALVSRYIATKLSVFTFMTPIFGTLAGTASLGEHLDIHHIFALALTIACIVIVNHWGHDKLSAQATRGMSHENA
jgi:drug/metabolite transporter (DMT)-like permease